MVTSWAGIIAAEELPRKGPLWVKSGGRAFACGRSDLSLIQTSYANDTGPILKSSPDNPGAAHAHIARPKAGAPRASWDHTTP
jgi:hypothetical protein